MLVDVFFFVFLIIFVFGPFFSCFWSIFSLMKKKKRKRGVENKKKSPKSREKKVEKNSKKRRKRSRDKGGSRTRGLFEPDRRNLSALERRIVASKAKWRCEMCGVVVDFSYQVDHIVPFSEGGKSVLKNLQLVCVSCHQRKSILERSGTCPFCLKQVHHSRLFGCPEKGETVETLETLETIDLSGFPSTFS